MRGLRISGGAEEAETEVGDRAVGDGGSLDLHTGSRYDRYEDVHNKQAIQAFDVS